MGCWCFYCCWSCRCISILLGISATGIEAHYGEFNDDALTIVHLDASFTPFISILSQVDSDCVALSTTLGVWGWVFPAAFAIAGAVSWITGLLAMLQSINANS